MLLRALIVDDEPLACERLRALLEAESSVQIIGTCLNSAEALALVQRDPPDLLFLDVRMPEMDGFALIKALPPAPLPLVIVVTAHGEYAMRAFEAQAVDYLLKPFDRERLRQTLQRAQERLQAVRASQLHQRLTALRHRASNRPAPPERIPIKENGRILFVRLDDIDWIGAADNYVELHVGGSSHLLLSTLSAFQSRLPAEQFVRISRSTLVNFNRVREISFHRNGDGLVLLLDGTQLVFSRSHRRELAQFCGTGRDGGEPAQ